MARVVRRALFWRVYLTLLGSLLLVALLGALLGHALMALSIRTRPHFGGMAPSRLHILFVLSTVAGAVGVAAYPVVARVTRRLETLRKAVEAWTGGDLAAPAPVEGDDEIAAVAASFNAAAGRAQALLAAHKSLLANASHELRSPLTRLRVATEMFVAAPSAALLAAISGDIAELDGLVAEILLASRLDHGVDDGDWERVDCLALAAEEAARAGVAMLPVAEGASFETEGSPRLLRRMVRNLIDNAVKHGAPPVEVELCLAGGSAPARFSFIVRDHGQGIAADLRERVFEPFFRPAGWSEDGGAWGLGLSLVRQIAVRHGGAVTCATGDGGAPYFSVELPRAPAR